MVQLWHAKTTTPKTAMISLRLGKRLRIRFKKSLTFPKAGCTHLPRQERFSVVDKMGNEMNEAMSAINPDKKEY